MYYTISKRELQRGYEFLIKLFNNVEFSSEELDELNDTPNNILIRKKLGNYFSTLEEAENVVEKLKALRKLKDSGFKFNNWYYALDGNRGDNAIPIEIKAECKTSTSIRNLDLLFGGKL